MTKVRVGFVGLGVMGHGMAANIIKAGYSLVVHNRTRAKAESLISAGATWAETPAQVGAQSDIVLICVPDTPDVETVLFGKEGVAGELRPGSVVIDTSSISSSATTRFATVLKARGIDMLDSPVSGGPQAALDGKLTLMIGGDPDVLERVRPVLDAIGKSINLIGPNGAGQLCKACNQLVIVSTLVGISEAIALCGKAGVDATRMREALMCGSARSFVLENHAKRLLDGTLAPGFRGVLMQKDIRLACEAMRDFGVFAPGTAIAEQLLTTMVNMGHGQSDSAALGLVIQKLSSSIGN